MPVSSTEIREALINGLRDSFFQMKETQWAKIFNTDFSLSQDEQPEQPQPSIFDILSEYRDKDDGQENR